LRQRVLFIPLEAQCAPADLIKFGAKNNAAWLHGLVLIRGRLEKGKASGRMLQI
jgi:hypothetical protein